MNQPQPSPSLISQGFSSRVVMPECSGIGLPLVIGEAPGKTEDDTGIPFHPEAEAGGLFKRLMSRVGVERTRFNIANVVMQRPPYNELYDAKGYPMAWTHEAIEYWKPFLHQTIEELQPPVIIGLGRTALETLTGFTDIGTTRGYVNEARINLARALDCPDCGLGTDPDCFTCGGTGVIDGWDRRSLHIPTICTYHPAFLNYGQRHLSGVFIRDVLAALEIGESGWEETPLRITPAPSPDDFRWFCRQYNPDIHKLTVDIENPESRAADEDELLEGKKEISYEIDRMSFCYADDIGGWSIPFVEPYVSMAKELMASNGPKRGHNCRLHDFPRLQSHGFVINGVEFDTLDMWKHLNRTLPASLAFIAPFYSSCRPWKHEAHSQPEAYSALDAVHQHRIADGMERDLKASGQWETYQRHVVEIISTNHGVCTQMAKNGLPIDPVKIEAFKLELEQKHAERLARLQELVPEALKPVKQKQGLKKVPKSLEGCIRRQFTVAYSDLAKDEREAVIASGRFYGPSDEVVVSRYCFLLTFNPASHLQVKALIRHYGHKAKTDRKTKNETSSDDTLKSLVTKYVESKKASDVAAVESYRLIRECRAIDKVLGTYVKGWKPASDGLIHATPGIWGDMFRISWRKPNLAATVADKKEIQIAAGFRKCICVPEGEVIIESDWKGMESVIVAYLANDVDYMRLARFSPHAYLASHVIGRPADLTWSDEDLGAYLSAIKHDPRNTKVYDDSKHCIHGISYGMTSFLMAELYEMTRTKAQWYIDLFFSLFPRVKQWQQATMQKAHDECKLVNAWGYRMPFWNVFAWQQKRYERLRQLWVNHRANPTRTVVMPKKDLDIVARVQEAMSTGTEANDAISSLCYDLGDEAKSAISFLPRDIGAAMLKDALLRLSPLAKAGALRTCTHDSILAITSRKNADEVAWQKRQAMEAPQPLLGGLVIEVDQMMGQSWDKKAMSKWEAAMVVTV